MNKVVSAKPFFKASPTSLWVQMSNGRSGVFDVAPYTTSSFFSELKNPDYFSKVHLFFNGIGWPNGQDLGPDTVNAELQISSKANSSLSQL